VGAVSIAAQRFDSRSYVVVRCLIVLREAMVVHPTHHL
jgi:hypothetical protein